MSEHDEHHHDHELHVEVVAPREPDPRRFEYPDSEKVGAAARQAADKFGYTGGNPSFANAKHEVLDRNLSLHEAHVHNHDTLELVDVGGGV